jgi:hypothetical protein
MDSPLIAAAVLHSGRPRIRGVPAERIDWPARLRGLVARCIVWMRS